MSLLDWYRSGWDYCHCSDKFCKEVADIADYTNPHQQWFAQSNIHQCCRFVQELFGKSFWVYSNPNNLLHDDDLCLLNLFAQQRLSSLKTKLPKITSFLKFLQWLKILQKILFLYGEKLQYCNDDIFVLQKKLMKRNQFHMCSINNID